MTRRSTSTGFQVIDGDGRGQPLRDGLALPEPPCMGAAELAADLAELYALGLMQDVNPQALTDPHQEVRIDRTTTVTVHELLCELRNLDWFDAQTLVPRHNPAGLSLPSEAGEAAQRRALRWNGDDQLTLQGLLRGGVALRRDGAVMSRLWEVDHWVAMPFGQGDQLPGEGSPMSAWQDWCARSSQAGMRLPCAWGLAVHRLTLGDRAEAMHLMPPAWPFHNAALMALAHRPAMDPELPEAAGWTGSRLFALMAEAETLACQTAQVRAGRPDRMPRPGVAAARMTVWLSRDDAQADQARETYQAAATELADCAGNLLRWVGLANQARRGPQQFDPSLFLPLSGPERQYLNPSDIAPHVIVAGALATLMKAVFATSGPAQLHAVGSGGPNWALEDQVDRLASNVALMRCVTGGWFPAENHQDLRIGQAIALHLLRARMQSDNRSARMSLRDFDGCSLQLVSHPRHFGRGHAELLRNGEPIAWPQESGHPAAHLTEVS